ncbi:MAG: sarcosine oxidase subunit gamma [Rhizobiaceae bacterium]|nr:sarcosine oxidase subunit gamma [Rhizobiaceae bacterium]
MAEIARTSPLAGRFVGRPHVTVAPAPPATRLAVRAPATSRGALARALKVDLFDGRQIRTVGPRMSLPLGPDEWLVIDEEGADLAAICRDVDALHSAVDVSHRNVGILVSGIAAEAVLNAGCPRDLSLAAFPVGRAARTILGKVEIVLVRTQPQAFRVEVWRSFSDYAFSLLEEATRDPGF